MKRLFILFFLLILGCSPIIPASTPTNPAITTVLMATKTSTPTTTHTATHTATPSASPSAFTTPEQEQIRRILESYGHVDEHYLSSEYWQKLEQRIGLYGEARRLLTLEYHGDSYDMYDGSYSMNPDSFSSQIEYFMSQDYHFVTGAETIGFLEGWLTLPSRSVILTTDSSGGSLRSMPRVISLFRNLETIYGYRPHMQSYIWTRGMHQDTQDCSGDICWPAFREYLASGYFTFGSHTETHGDFSGFNPAQTRWDLTTNITIIRDELGLTIYSVAWPLEACSPHTNLLNELGIRFAFGGNTRGLDRNFTYFEDSSPLCLPRLFPPNPNGLSGRPGGYSLKDMLSLAADHFSPLK